MSMTQVFNMLGWIGSGGYGNKTVPAVQVTWTRDALSRRLSHRLVGQFRVRTESARHLYTVHVQRAEQRRVCRVRILYDEQRRPSSIKPETTFSAEQLKIVWCLQPFAPHAPQWSALPHSSHTLIGPLIVFMHELCMDFNFISASAQRLVRLP
jgi:hypothetical protein